MLRRQATPCQETEGVNGIEIQLPTGEKPSVPSPNFCVEQSFFTQGLQMGHWGLSPP